MKYNLLEHKFILQESKFILQEALDDAAFTNAIALIDRELAKNNTISTKVDGLAKAYDTYKQTLAQTKTSKSGTSDFGASKTALITFWKAFKASGLQGMDDNVDLSASALYTLVNKESKLIDGVDNLISGEAALPTENGNEVNKKLWLKAMIDVENTFGKLIPTLKTKALTFGSSDTTKLSMSKNLEFLKKTLEIFKQSYKGLQNETTKSNLDKLVGSITTPVLQSEADLKNLVKAFNDLNNTIKSDTTETAVAAKNESSDWNTLYQNTKDKKLFWDKYFKEYWGSNAQTVINLGSAFKLECENYGFTDLKNPFIKYLKNYLLAKNITFNSGQYQAIHNLVAQNVIKSKDLADVKTANNKVLYIPDLFTKDVRDLITYLKFGATAVSQNHADLILTYFTDDGTQNGKLKSLLDIKQNWPQGGLDGGNQSMDSSNISNLAKAIMSGNDKKRNGYLRALIQNFIATPVVQTNWYKTLRDAGIDVTNAIYSRAEINKFTDEILAKVGEPSEEQVKQILNNVINIKNTAAKK